MYLYLSIIGWNVNIEKLYRNYTWEWWWWWLQLFVMKALHCCCCCCWSSASLCLGILLPEQQVRRSRKNWLQLSGVCKSFAWETIRCYFINLLLASPLPEVGTAAVAVQEETVHTGGGSERQKMLWGRYHVMRRDERWIGMILDAGMRWEREWGGSPPVVVGETVAW